MGKRRIVRITITGDAFNAFVFLEISSLSTYVLIAMSKDRRALLGWDYKLPQSLKEASFRLAKGEFNRDSRERERCSPLV